MLPKIVAAVCALALMAGCSDIPTQTLRVVVPSGAPAVSAWSPTLGPPLAFVAAVDRGHWYEEAHRAQWYEVASRPVTVPKRRPASRPPTTSPKSATERPATNPPRTSSGAHRGYATAKECVMWVENGGDYGRSTNPTHFGREQWSRATWAAYGGNPAHWGTASPAEQDAVFERAWNSPGGPANWLPYDHC